MFQVPPILMPALLWHRCQARSSPPVREVGRCTLEEQEERRRLILGTATPTVPATLAIECLQTVPNKVEPAQRLIKSLKPFVAWQSTLAFLKDPPQSYMFPPVDILGGLDNISTIAGAGGFSNEFDFGLAIVYLLQSAHDGHFAFRPDVFKGFGFRNQMAMDIVSVSIDGIQAPKLYHFCKSTF